METSKNKQSGKGQLPKKTIWKTTNMIANNMKNDNSEKQKLEKG